MLLRRIIRCFLVETYSYKQMGLMVKAMICKFGTLICEWTINDRLWTHGQWRIWQTRIGKICKKSSRFGLKQVSWRTMNCLLRTQWGHMTHPIVSILEFAIFLTSANVLSLSGKRHSEDKNARRYYNFWRYNSNI